MYNFLLIDIDDTILNFRDHAEDIIRESAAHFGIAFGDEEFAVYHRVNGPLWEAVGEGRLSREGLYAIRWARVLEALNIEGDGPAVEAEFRRRLNECAIPEHGAPEALAALAKRFTLATASNAPQRQQELRLAKAGLTPYFTHIFTSQGIGADKPSPTFYERCLENLGNPDRRTVLMVGDDPAADVRGAAACGLDTCFVNNRGKTLPADCHPTFTVSDLADLPALL